MRNCGNLSGFPKHWMRDPGLLLSAAIAGILLLAPAARAAERDLSQLSIEALGNLQISSVSKRSEPISRAAAAVYVITREDIRRSGATSLPEALRLAPNLQVARVDSSQYAITARGFNSTSANKLLVLIDGRSVYTPLYSGVFWDRQDVLLEDIDRIEVVSGPGGTLWGANAVNGVVNVIMRSSADTQGNLVSAGGGNQEHGAAMRHGGRLGEDASYRAYVKGFSRSDTILTGGAEGQDSWDMLQAGFRLDRTAGGGRFSLQGDACDGSTDQPVGDDRSISWGNLNGHWSRQLEGDSEINLQSYYDHARRIYPGTFAESLDTLDLRFEHRLHAGRSHDVVWGTGYRWSRDEVENSAALAFLPPLRILHVANLFLQDQIGLTDHLKLTVGSKLEHNNYTGIEFQPSLRLAYATESRGLLWGAVSRAVRTPSRLDRELYFPGNPPYFIAGGPDFDSETVLSYELGYRLQPAPSISFAISAYYNVYDKLRSIEPTGGGASVFGNGLEGDTYGVESWGNYSVNDHWRLTLGYTAMRKGLELAPGSGDFGSLAGSRTDPSYQAFLRSTMNFAHNLELDLALRSIDELPSQGVPAYTELDVQVAWSVTPRLAVSLAGNNLLQGSHREFGTAATGHEIERSAYLKLQLEF